ncbi:hypothetical protein BED47_01765 [Gottfriedia luciferensis]|uniref:Lipoprotein n=1 Tax=Gottfriedia luciferensis TaxID=178774 RepID=A0ABX2ZVW1_9BACI|nr:hypothetical protein [Gottfriedia luciferensis]ODG93923.1 hypothetical protein BED47_01765 [Gottfriedia luciferensis]
MKKSLFIGLTSLLIPFGCENEKNPSLDTSKLKKFEQPELTKEQRKILPVTYKSSSIEEGLSALPFKLKIPNNLPLEVDPIKTLSINDIDHKGKKLDVQYSLSHIDKSTLFIVLVIVHNYKPELEVEENEANEIVKLKGGVLGTYTGNSTLGISYKLDNNKEDFDTEENTLVFNKKGIYYELNYVSNIENTEKNKQYVINIANQML